LFVQLSAAGRQGSPPQARTPRVSTSAGQLASGGPIVPVVSRRIATTLSQLALTSTWTWPS
jgi:hypothetical protein